MKKILILGGGGFIGGHLAKRLFNESNFVRVVDVKEHEYFKQNEYCTEFIKGDLRDHKIVESVLRVETTNGITMKYSFLKQPFTEIDSFDEVYQLAADMGGAGYIFTGENDANVMHNSALINLNVSYYATKSGAKKVFYSSSACMYPEHNQLDPNNPNCEESSAYPANPDSEYGWEKLFSERLYFSFMRNYGLNVRVARFHNIFGPYGTWSGGKEKAPAAMCRKVAESENEIEVWGDGKQTRSFLYIDDCVNAILKMMESNFVGPVNIGSEEMVTINQLAQMAIDISNKDIKIKNIEGEEFFNKYGFKCPVGVKGRNSDNRLFTEKIGNPNYYSLYDGMVETYKWINKQVELENDKKKTTKSK
jgi:nucleoside-diphosphate-sugar epimerase